MLCRLQVLLIALRGPLLLSLLLLCGLYFAREHWSRCRAALALGVFCGQALVMASHPGAEASA